MVEQKTKHNTQARNVKCSLGMNDPTIFAVY